MVYWKSGLRSWSRKDDMVLSMYSGGVPTIQGSNLLSVHWKLTSQRCLIPMLGDYFYVEPAASRA